MSDSQPQPEVDKERLHGEYLESLRWQRKLGKSATHKALDIPEDDMNINAHHHGITGRHLVAIVGLMLAGLLGWYGIDRLSILNMEPPAAVLPAVQEYEVEWWVDDPTEIVIEEKIGKESPNKYYLLPSGRGIEKKKAPYPKSET